MENRKYQVDARVKIYRALKYFDKVVYQSPTGSGKTVVAITILHDALKHGKRVAILTERKTLINQMATHCEEAEIPYGVIRAKDERDNWCADVQICSIQTLERRKRFDQGRGFDLFINDECHLSRKRVHELMQEYLDAKWIGLTATPWAKGMGNWWDCKVTTTTVKELIEQGYLSNYRAFAPPNGQINTKGVRLSGGEFNMKDLGERGRNEKLYANIVATWRAKAQGKPTLGFAIDIAHSKAMCARFRDVGVNSEHIDAYTDDQDTNAIIKSFARGGIDMLWSVSKLAVGFDAPRASVGIIARPTNSLMLHYQMMGRLLRPYPGKEEAIFLDHANNIVKHGFPDNPPDLELDTKGVSDRTIKRDKEKLPKACRQCGSLITGLVCESCGYKIKIISNIQEKKGELTELQRFENKATWMKMLKGYEKIHGYKPGWAIHKYKEKFGVDPMNKWPLSTLYPSDVVKKWVRSRNIAYSKRKAG